MNDRDLCIGKKFTVTEQNLLRTIISVRDERRRDIFPHDGPTDEDCKNLLRISTENCSEFTKNTVVNFLLKFGKLYKKDFQMLIDGLRRFEETNSNDTYRDHVCHSFRVWCLGYWLYRKGFKKYFKGIGHNQSTFDFVWYLTAFYHDIGYTEGHDYHGVYSGQILFNKLNETFTGCWTPNAIRAIGAISLHNCYQAQKEKIGITNDPYSALLIICDEIQEWGRNIPGHKKQYEIDKLQFCMNLSASNPSLEIKLFYPKKQPKPIEGLQEFVKEKDQKYRKSLSKRIDNLLIIARCVPY